MSESMVTEKEIINSLRNVLRDLFKSIDFIKLIDIQSEVKNYFLNQQVRSDLVAEVRINERKNYFLVFEVKSAGQPRYTRMAASELRNMICNKEDCYGVFAATFVSEESKQICRENGIGFVDLAGNCLFKFDNVYLKVEGRPNLYPNTRPLKSIFSTKSSRALRVLLCNPGKEWFVKDLAKEANISLGQASNIKQRLLDFEFIGKVGSGKNLKFRLSKPESLLMEWANTYTYKRNRIRNFYSLDSVAILEEKLVNYFKETRISYAFTITSGSSKVAPFLRYTRVFTYAKDNIDGVAKDLSLKEVTSGPNVSFLEPYDEGVFYGLQEIQGVKVVSDIQLYLDLQSYKGREEEAASFLLRQRMAKEW